MRTHILALAVLVTAAGACKSPDAADVKSSDNLAASAPAAAAAVQPITTLALGELTTAAQFEAMSIPSGGIIKSGRSMKFLVDLRTPASPKVHFMNGNFAVNGTTPDYAKYHYYFAKKHLALPDTIDQFNASTYFTASKKFLAGTVQTYVWDDKPVFGVQLYPQDVIKGKAALDATKIVAAKLKIAGAKFAFVATGNQQTTEDVAPAFTTSGILRLSLEQILGSVNFIPMHLGEAWGYLRIFPQNQDGITATDIVVFDELPLDLTVVAGTVTKAFQDANSHVNLKSKERNTPNSVLRDASPTNALLAPWADKPVHMIVKADGLVFEPTTDAVIAQKLAAKLNKPWLAISWDKFDKTTSYDAMCATSPNASSCLAESRKYGSKAANLSFLAHKKVLGRASQVGTTSQKLGYDLVPKGFGIPLQFYVDLVDFPANKMLKDKLAALVTKEKAGTLSAAERVALLQEVQALFYKAKFPPGNLAKIKASMAAVLPGIKKVKVRSSANAEDIEGFDGAGLHDSYSAKPEKMDNAEESCVREEETEDEGEGAGVETKSKMKPQTLACGIKGVYASMWNKRAIEERSFARIDHATIAMGISVLPAYDFESPVVGNAVVVTRVINSSEIFGYTLSLQRGNNLVTNPTPGTWSETTIAAIGLGAEPTTLTVTRFAKPSKDGAPLTVPVMDKAKVLQLVNLIKEIEVAYCKAKPGYYAGECKFVAVDASKPKSLDFELKLLENGHWVIKQIREFSGK